MSHDTPLQRSSREPEEGSQALAGRDSRGRRRRARTPGASAFPARRSRRTFATCSSRWRASTASTGGPRSRPPSHGSSRRRPAPKHWPSIRRWLTLCSRHIAQERPRRWSSTTATPGIGAHGPACADTCSSISGSSRRRQTMTSTSISRWMTRGTSSRSSTASPIGPHWSRSPNPGFLGDSPQEAIQLGTVPISTVPIRATGGEAGSPGRSVGARDLTDDPAHAGLGRDPRPSRFTARRASLRRRADDGRHPRQRRAH